MYQFEIVARRVYIVGIRTDERCLYHAQHIGRSDVACGIALGPTIVAKVIGITRISEVQTCNKVLEHVYVGVETNAQAVEVVFLGCGIALGITQREVIQCHIITTINAHLVVLRECVVIEVLLPVCLVVIELIVEVVGILVEERCSLGAADNVVVGLGTNQFADVVAILAGIHHLHLLGRGFKTCIGTEVDARYHALATTGVDEQYAISAFCTITGSTVLDNFYAFNVIGVDDVEHVVDKALVQRAAVVLHIEHYTINNDERLCIAVE